MRKRRQAVRCVLRVGVVVLGALLVIGTAGNACAQGDARRGQYLVKAGGCLACHTENKEGSVAFAGGRALKTPFGTFYGPNITSHPEAGIGRWTEADFVRAMRLGNRPDGSNLFPAFPYPSFTLISDTDLSDLWAFLRALPPSPRTSRDHELRFPFGWRFPITFWKRLYVSRGPFAADPRAPQIVSRGAYLAQALSHCGECHTPRDFLGGPKRSRFFAGGAGPDGKRIPNLTPTRLKKWDDAELKDFLVTGLTPDGDVAAETMAEVIRNTTSQLTAEDLTALIRYLRSLPPLADEPA